MTEPMKTAIEYLAHELSIRVSTIEENPESTLTVEECQRIMNGFATQQVAAERERIKEMLRKDWEPIMEGSAYFEKKLGQLIDSL